MTEKAHSEMTLEEKLCWGHLSETEKYQRAVPPLKLWCDKGRYKESKHRTVFDVREYDSLDRELDSFSVQNQRETGISDGKKKRFYVWSCSCQKENCRHIMVAKRIYFAEWRKKKDAEAWLLENDPNYLTPKMAAEGYISWGEGAAKAKEMGLL